MIHKIEMNSSDLVWYQFHIDMDIFVPVDFFDLYIYRSNILLSLIQVS